MKDRDISIGVVIGTKDREDSLATCLASLISQTRKPDEIVVVDDGSIKDGWISELLRQHGVAYSYIRKEKDHGLVFSRNIGADLVKSDIVLFLDDDVILDQKYVKEILKVYKKDTALEVGGVGGMLVEKQLGIFKRTFLKAFGLDDCKRDGEVLRSGIGVLIRQINTVKRVEWLSGCNMSFRKRVFDDFRFDESFGGNGWGDDRDFSYRVSRRYRLLAAPAATLVHVEDPAGRAGSVRFGFMETYHTYMFFKKNMTRSFLNQCALWWALTGITVKNLFLLNFPQVGGNLSGIGMIFKDMLNSLKRLQLNKR